MTTVVALSGSPDKGRRPRAEDGRTSTSPSPKNLIAPELAVFAAAAQEPEIYFRHGLSTRPQHALDRLLVAICRILVYRSATLGSNLPRNELEVAAVEDSLNLRRG